MKTSFPLLILLSFACILFGSCKKSSTTEELTIQQKIQAKWNFTKEIDNDFHSGTNHVYTTIGQPGEYMDFRADGKIYSSVSGYRDTISYSVTSDNKILVVGLYRFDVVTLNSNTLTMYNKDSNGGPDYYEMTWYLNK